MLTTGSIDYKLLYEQQLPLIGELEFKVSALTHQLEQLKKMIFGSKSERFIPSTPGVTQGVLFEEEPTGGEACSVTATKEVSYLKTKMTKEVPAAHPGRMKLPEHLRREIIRVEPKEDVSRCKKIGEEVTEELECTPLELFVKQYVRPKYIYSIKEEVATEEGDKGNKGKEEDTTNKIVIAEMPVRPLHKCIAGPGLLTQVVIDKYVDHLPLNRQLGRFSRSGVNLPISTITGWVSGVCELIKPVWEALLLFVLNAGYIHVDETTIKVLDKSKKGNASTGSAHLGYFWVYTDSIHGLAYFDYQPGRGREGPEEILKDFKGYIQTDGYEVYEQFDKRADITQLCCMAHARRKFHEALDNDKARSEYALTQMKLLYDIERECKGFIHEKRKGIRQQRSVPILNELGKWMQEEYIKVPPKSVIGLALAYSLNRWDKLKIYTTDGKLCIDNNPVERNIRPITLGRKNYLFCGSHEAAKRAGILYSLLGTCKMHDVNPFEWLKDVITKLPTHPKDQMNELLPHIWHQQRSPELVD